LATVGTNEAVADRGVERHERLVSVPTPGAVVIDGDWNEWDLSGAAESVYDPTLADANDHAARWMGAAGWANGR
jgi:hypothetical protein